MTEPDSEPTELMERLASAVSAGNHDLAIRLAGQLQEWLTAAGATSAEREDPTDREGIVFTAPPSVVRVQGEATTRASARQTVVAALAELGVPSRAKLVAGYAEARFGERVEASALAGLRRDERRSWSKGSSRPSHVVPALEGRFYQPIRGLLALSDWSLERRMVGPWSERADHLAATAQLARQLAWLNDRDREVAERLAPIVAGMARSVPGAVVGDKIDTARVERAAEAELREFAVRDTPWRQEAAARAREQLSPEEQLWGVTVGVVAAGEREGR